MAKEYIIGQPGGPSGPFWSVIGSDGEVVAMQIMSEEYARRIADMLNAQLQVPQPDWSQAPESAMWAVAVFQTYFKGPVRAVWVFSEREPTDLTEFGWRTAGQWGTGDVFDIPFGIDPRTLKVKRPEAQS